jgi:RsiW-degrading membrane proteinase PrsW (M82 family)
VRSFLRRAAWPLLLVCGIAVLGGYAAILLTSSDHDVRRDSGILAGFGAALLIAAGLLVVAVHIRPSTLRFAWLWPAVVVFALAIAGGAFAARSASWPALDPLLAIVAICATFVAFASIAARWAPNRSVDGRSTLYNTIWGMTLAPAIALALELIGLVVLVAGGTIGLYIADPDLVRTISDDGLEVIIERSGNDLITTPTIVIGIVAMYAILAPLSEEFAKLLGPLGFMRRASATRLDAYSSGVFVGLGFASVETLAYALAAGEQWPLIAALRAPVAVIHVTAAATAALGVFAGGKAIVRGYGAAVLVHGAWNGLTVAVLVMTAALENPENVPPTVALATFLILAAMTGLAVGCFVWLTRTARKLGSDLTRSNTPSLPEPAVNAPGATDRGVQATHYMLSSL